MTFIIAQDDAFVRRASAGNVVWDANHFQPAATLNGDERAQFGVYPLAPADKPTPDPRQQIVREADPVKIAGVWTQAWDVIDLTSDEVAAAIVERKADMKAGVMALRTEKIEAGVAFGGARFQTRPDDQTNIAGAVLQSTMFQLGGGSPSSLRWHGGSTDFAWIAEDNSLVPMTAAAVCDFGRAVSAHKSACIFAAYAIKAGIDAAADHAALDAIDINAGWPA